MTIKAVLALAFFGVTCIAPVQASDLSEAVLQLARQEYPSDTLYQLWLDYSKEPKSLDRFYDALDEKLIIEPHDEDAEQVRVTYFAKGSKNTDYILQSGGPDFYGLRFKQIGESPYYFCIQNIPKDAWFTYGVNEFKREIIDKQRGLYQSSMTHIHDGTVLAPDAPISAFIESDDEVPQGDLKEFTLHSNFLEEERTILVYVPAGYDQTRAHNLVVQLDGQNYARSPEHGPSWQGWTPMPTILDNLMKRQSITPTIAIFVVNQGRRSQDLRNEKFADFIALEVIAWAKQHYAIANRDKIIVSGPSRAGFMAAWTAMRHSAHVGGVLAQSGSFYYTLQDKENWPVYPEFDGWLLSQYKHRPTQAVSFFIDVGLYDLGLGRVGYARQFRDILELKGYEVRYEEYKGGHSHLNWRHTLPNGLLYFFSKK